jgi:hypothetical protein
MNYRSVSISVAGQRLDPEKVIASHHKASLPPIEKEDGAGHDVELEIIDGERMRAVSCISAPRAAFLSIRSKRASTFLVSLSQPI